jgi:hypothetical protein
MKNNMLSFKQYLKEDQEKQKIAKRDFMESHAGVLERAPSYNFGGKDIKLKKVVGKQPHELEEGEFSFYEPSELKDSEYRGDAIVKWQGKIISYDLKGKLHKTRETKQGKPGKHQNDYMLPADIPLQLKKASGKIKQITPRHMAELGARFGIGAVSSKGDIQRVYPATGKEQRQAASQVVKGHIPSVLSQLGTAFTISGSKQGVAVTAHHTQESNKETRDSMESFLTHIGHAITHEPHELGTAGSPEFKPQTPERGARGTLRVSLDVNEKTQPLMSQNAKSMYGVN